MDNRVAVADKSANYRLKQVPEVSFLPSHLVHPHQLLILDRVQVVAVLIQDRLPVEEDHRQEVNHRRDQAMVHPQVQTRVRVRARANIIGVVRVNQDQDNRLQIRANSNLVLINHHQVQVSSSLVLDSHHQVQVSNLVQDSHHQVRVNSNQVRVNFPTNLHQVVRIRRIKWGQVHKIKLHKLFRIQLNPALGLDLLQHRLLMIPLPDKLLGDVSQDLIMLIYVILTS